MSIELSQIISNFEKFWPLSGAEDWDSPGLIAGAPAQQVTRTLLAVDVTLEIIDEAIAGQFDLILAHHPFLLKGVNGIAENTSKGAVLTKAIRSGVAIYAAHTNADIVAGGVSDALAKALGINHSKPIVSTHDSSVGHGRVGSLPKSMKLGEFAMLIAKVLPSSASGVRVSGDFDQPVKTVAVCGGAGDSLISAAQGLSADVFVTSDLRHHPTQDAKEHAQISRTPMALIDVSHWASEWLWLATAAKQLTDTFPKLEFVVSDIRTDPWNFVVTQ